MALALHPCGTAEVGQSGAVAGGAEKQAGARWEPPTSANRTSHFEAVNGREVWFVDGRPFTALGAETEWDQIVYPRYAETMDVYDSTYPAAEAMHMNMLKVPVKWSQVEPEEGKYDFRYVDHVRAMAQKYHLKVAFDWFGHYASGAGTLYSDKAGSMYAPEWVIEDARRFPRAVDADGKVHADAASYESPEIVAVESRAFAALMEHIREVDAGTGTVIGIQVENEVAVFGGHGRQDPRLWRDHSELANERYKEGGFSDDLKYTAEEYGRRWLRPLTDAGAAADRLPFFMNFVGGKLEEGVVGGSPGEDVGTYLKEIPALTFIGLNNYVSDPESYSADDFRAALNRYRVGRNLPAITETNSGLDPVAERSLFLAVGEYGAPLFTPWSLIISYPERDEPYVLKSGKLANGAFALTEVYDLVNRALPAVSYFGGTEHAKVFLSDLPGERFSQTREMDGIRVKVTGGENGQAMVMQPDGRELILVGYRCEVDLSSALPGWPTADRMHIEEGRWIGTRWEAEGKPVVVSGEKGSGEVRILLPEPRVVRVWW